MKALVDGRGRIVRYMRVSLTPACNYRCPFCVSGGTGGPGGPDGEERLSIGELLRLCAVFAGLGVDRFKVTGGEPFMHPGAAGFMAALAALPRVADVTVTTNGSTLDRHAAVLAAAGVGGVNVSLNAMTQAGYERVTGTRFSLRRVLDNIERAAEAGLRVKLNMVPLRGVNGDDIPALLEFALPRGIPVRFIELMPVGQGRLHSGLSFDEVRAVVERRFGKAEATTERFGNGPATYLSLPGYGARVGFIAAISRRFCAVCDRVRLNSAGFLRTCLHHGHGADLSPFLRRGEGGGDGEALAARIREVVSEKPQGHDFSGGGGAAHDEPMFRIGG